MDFRSGPAILKSPLTPRGTPATGLPARSLRALVGGPTPPGVTRWTPVSTRVPSHPAEICVNEQQNALGGSPANLKSEGSFLREGPGWDLEGGAAPVDAAGVGC